MDWQSIVGGSPTVAGVTGVFFVLMLLWSLVWKGMALWKAAHQENKVWFVVLLVVNTIGILDILYIYVFSKKSGSSPSPSVEAPKM